MRDHRRSKGSDSKTHRSLDAGGYVGLRPQLSCSRGMPICSARTVPLVQARWLHTRGRQGGHGAASSEISSRQIATRGLLSVWQMLPLIPMVLLSLLGLVSPLQAAPRVQWQDQAGNPNLIIDLESGLTPQQKKLIFSGFSTFSHLEVHLLQKGGRDLLVFLSECTIKFDLWEEKFDLLYFLERKRSPSLKSFDEYASTCLRAQISSLANLKRLQEEGNRLQIRLDIAQVSNEFAQDVRTWLIQQQSGVMRGLFSHMLGELKLNETLLTELDPPPPPSDPKRLRGSLPLEREALHGP